MRHATARPTRKNLTLALTSLALVAGGFTGALTLGHPTAQGAGVGAPTPSLTASPSCEEDMPCWVCSPKDDSCGADPDEDKAWAVWEESDGAHKLKVDPSRPYRVDWMAVTDDYPQNMDSYDLALVGKDGRWYVFRASYTDKTT